MFEGYSEIAMTVDGVQAIDVVAGLISFFVVGLGGVAIGLVWSFVISFTTRYSLCVNSVLRLETKISLQMDEACSYSRAALRVHYGLPIVLDSGNVSFIGDLSVGVTCLERKG